MSFLSLEQSESSNISDHQKPNNEESRIVLYQSSSQETEDSSEEIESAEEILNCQIARFVEELFEGQNSSNSPVLFQHLLRNLAQLVPINPRALSRTELGHKLMISDQLNHPGLDVFAYFDHIYGRYDLARLLMSMHLDRYNEEFSEFSDIRPILFFFPTPDQKLTQEQTAVFLDFWKTLSGSGLQFENWKKLFNISRNNPWIANLTYYGGIPTFHWLPFCDFWDPTLLFEQCKLDMNAGDIHGNTILHLASLFNHLGLITEMLESPYICYAPKNKQGQTPRELCNSKVRNYAFRLEEDLDEHNAPDTNFFQMNPGLMRIYKAILSDLPGVVRDWWAPIARSLESGEPAFDGTEIISLGTLKEFCDSFLLLENQHEKDKLWRVLFEAGFGTEILIELMRITSTDWPSFSVLDGTYPEGRNTIIDEALCRYLCAKELGIDPIISEADLVTFIGNLIHQYGFAPEMCLLFDVAPYCDDDFFESLLKNVDIKTVDFKYLFSERRPISNPEQLKKNIRPCISLDAINECLTYATENEEPTPDRRLLKTIFEQLRLEKIGENIIYNENYKLLENFCAENYDNLTRDTQGNLSTDALECLLAVADSIRISIDANKKIDTDKEIDIHKKNDYLNKLIIMTEQKINQK